MRYMTKVLFVGAFFLIILIQINYDANSKPFLWKFETQDRVVLPPQVIKTLSFGFDNVIADAYWIQVVQDIIGWNETDMFFVNYFKNIAVLDPKFEYPYRLGIFVVPSQKNPELLNEMAKIADTGMQALPENWEIPFYLGTAYNALNKNLNATLRKATTFGMEAVPENIREYFTIETAKQTIEENKEHIERYLSLASAKESAPAVVRLVYSSYTTKTLSSHETGLQMLKAIYDTTDNETIKKIAIKGIVLETLNDSIGKAIVAYKLKFKSYPKNLSDLENNKFFLMPTEIREVFDIEFKPNGNFRIIEKE